MRTVVLHVWRSSLVPAAKRFQMDFKNKMPADEYRRFRHLLASSQIQSSSTTVRLYYCCGCLLTRLQQTVCRWSIFLVRESRSVQPEAVMQP
eukprot:COSAG01_NODE_689_length_14220_cov_363.812903_10_plen_92_part_00